MSSSDLSVEVSDHIAIVTMRREPVNALNPEFRQQLVAVFDEMSDRDDVRVVILTSALAVFSAGADLKEPAPGQPGEWGHRNRLARETKNALIECAKPVIAAINGPAIGAGFGLAGACDILVASDDAVFAMPEIDVGLAGGASLLRQYLGRSRMRRMILTGMRVSAAEMYRLGVVEDCVPTDSLMETALDIARVIASKSPVGIKYAKRSLNLVELMPPRDAYRFEQDYTVDLARANETAEIRLARVEKRRPDFDRSPIDVVPRPEPVGVIGFGVMGSGIAGALVRSGRQVVGFDTDGSKSTLSREIGADFAADIAEVAARCREVILVLPDGPDVIAVTQSLRSDGAGKLIVDCSTIDPELSRTAASTAAEYGAVFADAGMGGGATNARDGSLLFMVGCEPHAWPDVERLLHPIARSVVHCGGPGAGVSMKAITNLLWLSNYAADVEALIFAKAAGISPDVAVSVLDSTGASNRALSMAAQQLLTGDIGAGFPVRLAHKDVKLAVETARRLGLDLSSLEPTLSIFEEASTAGLGAEGVAIAGTVLEQRHGIDLSERSGSNHPDGAGGK